MWWRMRTPKKTKKWWLEDIDIPTTTWSCNAYWFDGLGDLVGHDKITKYLTPRELGPKRIVKKWLKLESTGLEGVLSPPMKWNLMKEGYVDKYQRSQDGHGICKSIRQAGRKGSKFIGLAKTNILNLMKSIEEPSAV